MSFQEVVYTFISSFMALFPVMNPISSGFIINGFLEGLDDDLRKTAIKKIIVNCLLIGVGSLIAGHLILLLFGLAVPVIQLGGGFIICKAGLEWLSDSGASKIEKTESTVNKINPDDFEKKIFYPISFPISLGPGSISVIFTLMAAASVSGNWLKTGLNYFFIILAIIALLIILYLFLSQGNRLMKKLGRSGNMIINKMVAFITFCVGIQIAIVGISKIFHLTVL
ncbi:MarC family protein [Parabacteroides sp. OttesenSCG-928-G07]|nr:MarC family protein [Parabacteroides sp. OttesenSCG-928-G07]